MSVTAVSSQTFGQHPSTYFDLVDRGEHVIVKRGQKQAYAITPFAVEEVQENDGFPTAYDLKKIDNAVARAERGEAVHFATIKELDSYIDTLINVQA